MVQAKKLSGYECADCWNRYKTKEEADYCCSREEWHNIKKLKMSESKKGRKDNV